MEWWDMFTIVGGNDWLCIWCGEHPALCDPCFREIWDEFFEMREEFLHDLFFAHFKEAVIHRTIIAQIDEVTATILCRCTQICVIDDTGEWIALIAYVNPVAVGERSIQSEDQTVCSIGCA